MNGKSNDEGILIRCLDTLFNSIKDYQTEKYVFKPDKNNAFDILSPEEALYERTRSLQQQTTNSNSLNKLPTTTPRKGQKEEFFTSRSPDTTVLQDVCEDNGYAVFVSFIEIYNNYIYDLLDDVSLDQINMKMQTSKPLKEDTNHFIYVNGCNEVEIKSTDEALEVLYKGLKKKRMACTILNAESSRSHSVFNIKLVQTPLDASGEYVIQDKSRICNSQLALVDLAGSERSNRTQNQGDRLREAGNINSSLMVLRNCLDILRENQKLYVSAVENNQCPSTMMGYRIVPYRDTKLTHLFKNYFEGQGKVKMIVCINPDGKDFEENLHVARFAELTQEIQINRANVYASNDPSLPPGRRHMAKLMAAQSIKNLRWETESPELLNNNNGDLLNYNNLEGDVQQQFPSSYNFEGNKLIDMNSPPPLFDLGPNLLNVELIEMSDLKTLEQLENVLEQKRSKISSFHQSILANLDDIFNNSGKLHNAFDTNEINRLKKEIYEAKSSLFELNEQNMTMNSRVKDLEKLNNGLARKLALYDNSQKNFETILDENELARRKMEKDMERQIKAKEIEMEQLMWAKNEKLRQLKKIVAESPSSGTTTTLASTALSHQSTNSNLPTTPKHDQISPTTKRYSGGDNFKSQIDSNFAAVGGISDGFRFKDEEEEERDDIFTELRQLQAPPTADSEQTNLLFPPPPTDFAAGDQIKSSADDIPCGGNRCAPKSALKSSAIISTRKFNNISNLLNCQQQQLSVKFNTPTSAFKKGAVNTNNNHPPMNKFNASNFLSVPGGINNTAGAFASTPHGQSIRNAQAAMPCASKSAASRFGHVASVARMYDAKVANLVKGVPVCHPRHHRRSKSAGDLKYLEHKPSYQNKTNDIMKTRNRNVTTTNNLCKKELKKCDKYFLNKQEQTHSGDLKTQIITGDVILTSSGGNAIIFDEDIEIHGHEKLLSSKDEEITTYQQFHNERTPPKNDPQQQQLSTPKTDLRRENMEPSNVINNFKDFTNNSPRSLKRLYPDLNEHILQEDAYFKSITTTTSFNTQNPATNIETSSPRKILLTDSEIDISKAGDKYNISAKNSA